MRTLSKIMLLALLALPMGSVFAAASNDITVTITVTLTTTIDIQFTDNGAGGTTAKTWTISGAGATLSSTHDAVTDGVKPGITNNTGAQVDVTAKIVANPANWTAAAAIAEDKFVVKATEATTPTTITLTTGFQAYQTISGTAPANVSAAGDTLSFQFPSTVTHTSPGGNIVVVYHATATP